MKQKHDPDILIQLRASEEKYRTFFENSMDAIFITSQEGSIYSANKAACNMLGYDEKDIIRIGRKGIVEPTAQLENALMVRKETGKFVGEIAFLKQDGTKIPVEITSSVFTSNGGEFTAIIARDITDKKQGQIALIESETRFRNLFDNTLVGISVSLPDGKILQVNDAFAKMYGYANPGQLYSQHMNIKQAYANPADREKVLKLLCEYGKMDETEIEAIRRDGSKFYVLVTANEVRDPDGNLIYNQASHIDLTDRKKTEEKARNASLYSRTLIEASLDPLITINSEGKITDVNISTEQITGVSRKKLIGSDFADHFANHTNARKGYKLVFAKGSVKNYPLSILHKSGRKIDVLFNATLFRDVAGDVQGVLAAARDITDLKTMEKELLNSKKLLENLNQHLLEIRENERSEIALNLHDDLGQRLTAINLDLAWLKGRVGVQTSVVIKKFNEISDLINETIDGIKEISAFLRPAILYDLGIVPAFELQLEHTEKISNIKCTLSYSLIDNKLDDRVSLILYRVLQESLTNVVRHAEATKVFVYLNVSKTRVILKIEDNGRGIEEKKINSLNSMGITGIRERVASVSGKVVIEGKKDEGTIISVQVPLKNKLKV